MALTLVQAASSLQLIHEDGTIQTLTLPTDVTLRTDIPPRWAIFGKYIVLVNTPDQPLTVDQFGTVRLLCPRPPRLVSTLTGVAGGSLSGSFKHKYTFFEVDLDGQLIYETDYSPATASALSISSKHLHVAGLDVLANSTASGRRHYRTTSGTEVYFKWFNQDNNTATEAQDDTPDAGIALFAAPARGTPPYLTHIAEFRNRLFGVSADDPDTLLHSEVAEGFAWPSDNRFPVPRVGSDTRGITALVPRRDALGIGRQTALLQFTGTDDTNFRIVKLSENVGIASQETVKVWRDTAFFLWYDGVYTWGPEGIVCISDTKVRSWFTKDDTFNRAVFESAFAEFDVSRRRYVLFLADVANSNTTINRWVEYDVDSGTWWGPHKSDKFAPTCAFTLYGGGNVPQIAIGANESQLLIEQNNRNDGYTHAIATSATMAPFFGESPEVHTYFGEVSLLTKAQSTGGMLTVTPAVGEPSSLVSSNTFSVQLNSDRKRIGRIGAGRAGRLSFTHSTIDEKLEVGGIEIPIQTIGRR